MNVFQLLDGRGDGGLLLLQLLDERGGARGDEGHLLRPAFAAVAIEAEELLDLRERKADGLRSQDEFQPGAVPPRVDAAVVYAGRRQKPLRLVEPDGARGDAELVREFGDPVEPLRLGGGLRLLQS